MMRKHTGICRNKLIKDLHEHSKSIHEKVELRQHCQSNVEDARQRQIAVGSTTQLLGLIISKINKLLAEGDKQQKRAREETRPHHQLLTDNEEQQKRAREEKDTDLLADGVERQ